MTQFHALIDAVPGRQKEVEAGLSGLAGVRATPCREGNHDFLVAFDAASFDVVDDFLQTHVRRLPGVLGVEVVTRWEEYSPAVREARARLG